MRNRRKTKRGALNRRARKYVLVEADVRAAALERGMQLVANAFEAGRGGRFTLHWMFNDAATGERLLDFWPTTGTWFCRRTGQKGRVRDVWHVLEVASKLGAEGDALANSLRSAP